MIFLNASDLTSLAQPLILIKAIEDAMLLYDQESYKMPARMHFSNQQNTHLLMPALNEDAYAVKLVSVFPGNKQFNKPIIQGMLSLFHHKTGEPLAIMDAAKLTALRTAGVGAVAVKTLSDPEAKTLGMVGLGVQGLHLAIMIAQVRNLQRILISDYNPLQSTKVAHFLKQKLNLEIITCKNISDLVKHSEIIVTATNSATPVLPNDPLLYKNQCICAMGSYKPSMQEIPDVVFENLSELYCDTFQALQETGDIINPLENNLIHKEQIKTLGERIKSPVAFEKGLTCFKSVGMALFDLTVSKALYDLANDQGKGQLLNT